MRGKISRRVFLQRTPAGAVIAGALSECAWAPAGTKSLGPGSMTSAPADRSSYPPGAVDIARRLNGVDIWDVHCHLAGFRGGTPEERMAGMIRFADRVGVSRMCVSGYGSFYGQSAEGMRRENDDVLRAVAASHGRALGLCFLRPQYTQACLDELNRCIKDGPMVGIGELEVDVLCNSPLLDPIVERATSLKAPILKHTWIKTTGNLPGESTPYDLVELAKRHPAAQFICGHTGGNWELGIRAIRGTGNICAGIAGSDPTSGFVEMAVRELGAERVVYGSDVGGRSFASQVAKVAGADIPDAAKELVFGGNARRIYAPILRAKGYALA
ncbi:MAG: amidohydrolase family protein [Terriglobia bacterium]